MPGVARKSTVVGAKTKQNLEDENKEKIKFDIFDEEEPGLNKYKSAAPILDNVRLT